MNPSNETDSLKEQYKLDISRAVESIIQKAEEYAVKDNGTFAGMDNNLMNRQTLLKGFMLLFQAEISRQSKEARIDEWIVHVLGKDIDKFYPTDQFNDFISVPSFHINKRLKALKAESSESAKIQANNAGILNKRG